MSAAYNTELFSRFNAIEWDAVSSASFTLLSGERVSLKADKNHSFVLENVATSQGPVPVVTLDATDDWKKDHDFVMQSISARDVSFFKVKIRIEKPEEK